MKLSLFRWIDFILSVALVTVGTLGASVYTNLSFEVTNPDEFAWFPPFQVGVNANMNEHLGAEYYEIAQSLRAGRGYSDPFRSTTGPTAWMAPLFTYFLAGALWWFEDDKVSTMNLLVVCQAVAMALTGILTLALARRTAPAIPSLLVTLLIAIAVTTRFHMAYQVTHDTWVVLLACDALVVGMVWGRVTERWWRAVLWGISGGLMALSSPVVALGWGIVTLADGVRTRNYRNFGLAVLLSALVLSPWVVRNWIVFGRFIPVKSNLAYELYQSQLLNDQGRLTSRVFGTHPYSTPGPERSECQEKGEMAFLDAKRAAFWQSVKSDPDKFFDKVFDRALAATVDYSPMDEPEYKRETLIQYCYLTHPLPFFAAVGLLLIAPVFRLSRETYLGLAVMASYLLPYIVVSYYDRYELPIWGLKTLVIVWWLDAMRKVFGSILGFRREESIATGTGLMKP